MSFLVTSLTIGTFLYCKNQAIRIAILKQNILQINRFSFRGIPKVEELSVSDLEFGKSKLWWLVTSRTNPKQFYRLDKEGTIHDKMLFDRIFIQRASSDPTKLASEVFKSAHMEQKVNQRNDIGQKPKV
jgi:hypothetical protein